MEKQHNHFMIFGLPIRAKGLGGRGQGLSLRENAISCIPTALGTFQLSRAGDLRVTIPGAIMMESGEVIKDDEVKCRDLSCTFKGGTVLHVLVATSHIFTPPCH